MGWSGEDKNGINTGRYVCYGKILKAPDGISVPHLSLDELVSKVQGRWARQMAKERKKWNIGSKPPIH